MCRPAAGQPPQRRPGAHIGAPLPFCTGSPILLLFAAGQYWLCRKTTRLALRLIPLYAVAALLVLAAVEYASYNPGGFLDLSAFVAAVIAVYAAACALSAGGGWLIWSLQNRKQR